MQRDYCSRIPPDVISVNIIVPPNYVPGGSKDFAYLAVTESPCHSLQGRHVFRWVMHIEKEGNRNDSQVLGPRLRGAAEKTN